MKIAELKEYRKILNNVQSIEKQIISLESQINKITSVVNDTPRGDKFCVECGQRLEWSDVK